MTNRSMQTPLGRVRGLGSAKEGVDHWWLQRLTAAAQVPLVLWFIISLASMAGAGHDEVVAWLSHPVVTVLTVLMVFSLYYHAKLGLQVVIEDYISTEGVKLVTLTAMKFALILFGTATIFSVLKIAFGG
ncbi:MAG: succinate dehydrogenase, hydrophobic membrane anchor protein [Thalassobaculaceae bacterium]